MCIFSSGPVKTRQNYDEFENYNYEMEMKIKDKLMEKEFFPIFKMEPEYGM